MLISIYEPIYADGAGRRENLQRFRRFVDTEWTMVTPAERGGLWEHAEVCDFPGAASGWIELGRAAGCTHAGQVFTGPAAVLGVFRYEP